LDVEHTGWMFSLAVVFSWNGITALTLFSNALIQPYFKIYLS